MTSVSSLTKWGCKQWKDICCSVNGCKHTAHPYTPTHTHSNTVLTVGCNILGIENQDREEELSFPRRGLSPQISVTEAPHQWAAAKRISIRWRDGKGVKEEAEVAEEHKKEEKGGERRGR